MLHLLDMSVQGFVGLTYWKLLVDCCLSSIRIADGDGISEIATLEDWGAVGREQPVDKMVSTFSERKCSLAGLGGVLPHLAIMVSPGVVSSSHLPLPTDRVVYPTILLAPFV